MMESDWLTCTYPVAMLDHLHAAGSTDDRKLRLFACACARRVWHLMDDVRSRRALETLEAVADSVETLAHADAIARAGDVSTEWSRRSDHVSGDRGLSTDERARWNAADAVTDLADATGPIPRHRHRLFVPILRAESLEAGVEPTVDHQTDAGQFPPLPWAAALARDVFGNPWRHASLDSARRSPDALSLAGSIYEGRDWDRMPILGDALEEAGCDDKTILDHCRSGGIHARGCWVVDAVLGKG
jgi:hypothetical protein